MQTQQKIIHSSGTAIILCAAAFLFACVSLAGCRFKVPNVGEGQEFARRGAFPEGAPSWVQVPPELGVQRTASAGIVPLNYSAPPVVKNSQASIPSGEMAPEPDPTRDRAAMQRRSAQSAGTRMGARSDATSSKAEATSSMAETGSPMAEATAPVSSAVSPIGEAVGSLAKIDQLCPGTEKRVNDALTTTDMAERIAKYEALTARCPESSDLWVWLGKDYESMKMFSDAGRCYQRAIGLDPSNAEAKSLYDGLDSPRPKTQGAQ